ncbi:MAG: hypothetical protein V4498_05070 [candidate division FCPU426 bacterium]
MKPFAILALLAFAFCQAFTPRQPTVRVTTTDTSTMHAVISAAPPAGPSDVLVTVIGTGKAALVSFGPVGCAASRSAADSVYHNIPVPVGTSAVIHRTFGSVCASAINADTTGVDTVYFTVGTNP